jgi:hypothetical protein
MPAFSREVSLLLDSFFVHKLSKLLKEILLSDYFWHTLLGGCLRLGIPDLGCICGIFLREKH